MKKFIVATFVTVSTITFLGGCGEQKDDIVQLQNIVENSVETIPERNPDINGVIASMNGNVIVVKNEVNKEILTEEEQAEKKAKRQQMTQEERRALKAQEIANAQTQDVTIELPVGVVMTKGAGKGDGSNVKATFDDLKIGTYISVWKTEDSVEAVKIKGL